MVDKIENELDKLDWKFRLAYASGFIDAEGSVNIKKCKLRIYQKNTEYGKSLLERVRKSLLCCKIKTSEILADKDDLFYVDILSGKKLDNIMRFRDISYIKSRKKLEKLDQICASIAS